MIISKHEYSDEVIPGDAGRRESREQGCLAGWPAVPAEPRVFPEPPSYQYTSSSEAAITDQAEHAAASRQLIYELMTSNCVIGAVCKQGQSATHNFRRNSLIL